METISLTDPAKTGCTFAGWAASSGGANAEYTDGGGYTMKEGSTTLCGWKT